MRKLASSKRFLPPPDLSEMVWRSEAGELCSRWQEITTPHVGRWYSSEAACAVEYCLKGALTPALDEFAPYKRGHMKIPKLSHLRVLRCTAYVISQLCQRRKLDDEAWAGRFLGYVNDSPSNCMYNRMTKSVHPSRNMRLDENDCVTGHQSREKINGRHDMKCFSFMSPVTLAVTRSRVHSERGNRTLKEEPARTQPKHMSLILMSLTQASPAQPIALA